MKKARKKLATLALSLFALASFVVPAVTVESVFADTQTAIEHLSMTDIEDDLQDLDKTAYPYDKNGKTKVVRFQEYCYTQQAGAKDMYGIYLYVYNPTQKKVRATSNVVNMAVEYYNNAPTRYENIPLTLLDKTEDNRFIKFKVTDSELLLKIANAYALNHNGERRYDVSDVNLYYLDGSGSESSNVSKSYVWTGYAEGMNNNAESTLSCVTEELETLTLDVKHTYFRIENGENSNKSDAVHSVYFSVPNQVLDKYGALYSIHAEYLKARLKPALVLGDKTVFDEVAKYLWQDMSTHNESLDYEIAAHLRNVDNTLTKCLADYVFNYDENVKIWPYGDKWIQNVAWYSLQNLSENGKGDFLYLLFGTDTFAENSADAYRITSEKLKESMLQTAKHPKSTGTIVGADGEYSRDIFSQIDETKTDLRLTADDTFDLTQTIYEREHPFWDWLFDNEGTEVVKTIFDDKPVIHKVTEQDFLFGDYVASYDLLIGYQDFADFKKAYNEATANNETLFLFYYKTSNYSAYEAKILKERFPAVGEEVFELVSTNGYFFEQDVDLQFDIIDVMFRDEQGTETVLGVVSKPADFIPGSTPPNYTTKDEKSLWEKIKDWWRDFITKDDGERISGLALTLICVGAYLVLCTIGKRVYGVPFLLAPFHGAFFVVTLPIRGIVALIQRKKDKG